jgi:FdhD protein
MTDVVGGRNGARAYVTMRTMKETGLTLEREIEAEAAEAEVPRLEGPPPSAEDFPRLAWRKVEATQGFRTLPAEVPIALVHDATTTAVMMATPQDLEDFALGFSLTEGIIDSLEQVQSVEIVGGKVGIEARVWLDAPRSAALTARRRRIAGPTGCGLCGIDSLEEAVRSLKPVVGQLEMTAEQVQTAVRLTAEQQELGALTRAVHAAGFWSPHYGGLVAVREDVGRHNALDKLAGAVVRRGARRPGAVVLTSRVSVEMVQKAAAVGAPILIAVSAPTALAVRTAEAADITLVAVARGDGFEVFTRPDRILAR